MPAAREPPSPARAWIFLAFLALLFLLGTADRLALTLMVQPIKAELGLSDVQFGILVGTAFGVVFAVSSLPLAWVADRWNRKALLIIAVLFWSAMTFGSAFAQSYSMLLVGRIGLAVGEAALMPVAISLIGDLFEPKKRSMPTGVFMASAMVGATFAYVSAAFITSWAEAGAFAGVPLLGGLSAWRATLALLGIAGGILAAAVMLATKEPPRAANATDSARHPSGRSDVDGAFRSAGDAMAFFGLFYLGCSVTAMLSYSVASWYPTYLIRTFGHEATLAGSLTGLIFLVGGTAGTLLVPLAVQGLIRRGYARLIVSVAIGLALAGSAAAIVAGWYGNASLSVVSTGISVFCSMGIGTLAQLLAVIAAPAAFRGRVSATALFLSNMVGFGIGPVLVAWFGERFFDGPEAIGKGMATLALLIAPTALILMGAARAKYRRADFSYLQDPRLGG